MAGCPVCHGAESTKRFFSSNWWASKRCGRCRQLVCPGCVERPVLLTKEASLGGIKPVCKPCYKEHIGNAFEPTNRVSEHPFNKEAAETGYVRLPIAAHVRTVNCVFPVLFLCTICRHRHDCCFHFTLLCVLGENLSHRPSVARQLYCCTAPRLAKRAWPPQPMLWRGTSASLCRICHGTVQDLVSPSQSTMLCKLF